MSGLGEPQAASVNGREEGPGERIAIGAEGEETFDFVGTEDPGRLGVTRGPFDAGQEGFDLTAEMSPVKGSERIDGIPQWRDAQARGGSRKLALFDEVE